MFSAPEWTDNRSDEKRKSDDEVPPPTTMERIFENGKKDGFYCVFIHSGQCDTTTSEWLGPFDLETATFYMERHIKSGNNGSTLYKMKDGSRYSDDVTCESISRQENGNYIIKTASDEFVYGPFNTKAICYHYIVDYMKEDEYDSIKIKQAHFSLNNYARDISYAKFCEKRDIEQKKRNIEYNERKAASAEKEKEKQSKKKRKKN